MKDELREKRRNVCSDVSGFIYYALTKGACVAKLYLIPIFLSYRD
jgi:hypothetical protein